MARDCWRSEKQVRQKRQMHVADSCARRRMLISDITHVNGDTCLAGEVDVPLSG